MSAGRREKYYHFGEVTRVDEPRFTGSPDDVFGKTPTLNETWPRLRPTAPWGFQPADTKLLTQRALEECEACTFIGHGCCPHTEAGLETASGDRCFVARGPCLWSAALVDRRPLQFNLLASTTVSLCPTRNSTLSFSRKFTVPMRARAGGLPIPVPVLESSNNTSCGRNAGRFARRMENQPALTLWRSTVMNKFCATAQMERGP